MTKAAPNISFQSCPSCGSALSEGALTCGYCGSVTAVENISSRVRSEFRYWVGRAGAYLQDPAVLIWVLATVPVLILPPLLALMMCFRGSWNSRRGDAARQAYFSVFSVSVVAIVNIALSLIFWRWLSEISMSAGLSFGLFLKSLGIVSPRASLQAI
ncbi:MULTISPECIES: zinc ribbon domain-containing protein [unclassified Bradyrhizobium]|uniref:zinc ribbon domain-containing protein n=1 Tax=unclassified Bradyrhizobium TaxID=2631580 RepID=UPI0028ED914B|nr:MULTISPECIES: zinc ribbon domain-containing protein [unclassified Bradyrhizobium]